MPVTMWSESNITAVYWTFCTGLFLVKNYATTFQSMAQCPWMDNQGTVKTCASYVQYLLYDIGFDKGDQI